MMVTKALLVRLEALPGKEADLAEFLTEARSIVLDEPGTTAWFALQLGPSTFGVFDVFPDDDARDAHLAGGVGQALGPNTGVLFSEPQVEKIDLLADKLPG
ncbi:antibiotic biosynthesis monooxygenase [Nocardioides anomalus]|uniref:Antibiotic biosynthesis monooxygenase n=2 Tax=Nocardioides anomalus TaxID=2712223 RepID=A0A6G6WLI4_9ACTN|nr:antibiotic biosynthesis monooxygenase [Nocardioides anomalus]